MKFTRQNRLVILIVLGIVPPALALVLLKYTITGSTPAAIQAAVAGGIITAVGTVSSAIYKEVSSYFQQTDSNVDKKVTMISPLVQNYYSPWINSAQILHGALEGMAKNSNPSSQDVQSLLYYIMVYYGYRMKFIVEAGGLILLSSTEQQNAVHDAYRATELALDWEDSRTHGDVSYLQWLFLTKNGQPTGGDGDGESGPSAHPAGSTAAKPSGGQSPYLFFQFSADVPGDTRLSGMVDALAQWAKDRNKVTQASVKVDAFARAFQDSIDQLYTAWGQ